CESSIRWLIERKHSLAMLGEADTLQVLDQIAELHEHAYGWRRPGSLAGQRFYAPSMSAAERMRTRVRYSVEALDLAYLYGEASAVQAHETALPSLAEDPDLFAGASDEVMVEEVER